MWRKLNHWFRGFCNLGNLRQELRVFQQWAEHISSQLNELKAQGERLMTVTQDMKDLLGKIDTETTTLGANVVTLLGRVKNTMTDEEVAEIKSIGAAIGDRLHKLAADTADPVPPVPPPLAAARRKL